MANLFIALHKMMNIHNRQHRTSIHVHIGFHCLFVFTFGARVFGCCRSLDDVISILNRLIFGMRHTYTNMVRYSFMPRDVLLLNELQTMKV